MNGTIKTILTFVVLAILFVIALKVLSVALQILLPLAVVVIAAYIVYMFITKRR